jgi:S-adenosyl-L-methionine hydrolase (adenosine-forming)
MSERRSGPIVTLTSDFGLSGSYVAQMKGVLLSANPDLSLVDISHSIEPQNIREGALLLGDACPRFPANSIHIAVVDPGVGTERRIVFARIGTQRYIAPDNGLLTLLAQQTPPSQLINVTNRKFFLPEVTATFHGRDIMASVAGHLSLGLDPQQLGDPLQSLVLLPIPKATIESRRIEGQVLFIDTFGNLITNITREELSAINQKTEAIKVILKSHTIAGLVPSYGHCLSGALVTLIGSTGRLEVAQVDGNAARLLSAAVDDVVLVDW